MEPKASSYTSQSSQNDEDDQADNHSIASDLERELIEKQQISIETMQDAINQANSSTTKKKVKKTTKTTVEYFEDEEEGEEDGVMIEEDRQTGGSKNNLVIMRQEPSPMKVGYKTKNVRHIHQPEQSLLPPTPVNTLNSKKSQRSLQSLKEKTQLRVSQLESELKEMKKNKQSKDEEIQEKHAQFLENDKIMTKMKDEINALKTLNKRLEVSRKEIIDKSKEQIQKYKNKIQILQKGSQMILNQLSERLSIYTNYTIETMFQGICENAKYDTLNLVPFSLKKAQLDSKEWKSYMGLVFPKKKKTIKQMLTLFETKKTVLPKIVSDEQIKYDYKDLANKYDMLQKRSRRSSITEEFEDTFKTLKSSIIKSVSQKNISLSGNKPPLPPTSSTNLQPNPQGNSTGVRKDSSNKSFSMRKSNSRGSLLSSREGSPSKSHLNLSQMQVPEPINILDALRDYCYEHKDSDELPDKKFIAQFITYMFQTNIFRNLDSCLELLKSDENIELMNQLRKSNQFKNDILEGNEQKNSNSKAGSGEDFLANSNLKITRFDTEDQNELLIENHIYERLQDVKNKCDALYIANAELTEMIDSRQKDLDSKSSEYQELMSASAQLDIDLKGIDQKKDFYDTLLGDLKRKIQDLESTINTTNDDVETLKINLTMTSEAYYNLLKESQEQDLRKQKLDLKSQGLEKRISFLREKIDAKEDQINRKVEEIEQKETELINFQEDLKNLPNELLLQVEKKTRKLTKLELDIESRKMKIKIFEEKMREIQTHIEDRESKIQDLSKLEAEMEDKKQEINEKYKDLANKETQEMDLKASLDVQDKKIAQINQIHKDENLRQKFQDYTVTGLDPVSEANDESRGSTIVPGQRNSQVNVENDLTETIYSINMKLDELCKSNLNLGTSNGHKMSLRSLGFHSRQNSIPNSTYGTAYKDTYYEGDNTNNNSDYQVGENESSQSPTERTLKDQRIDSVENALRVTPYDQNFIEHQEGYQKTQLKLVQELSTGFKDFKKTIQEKIESIVKLGANMALIKDEINKTNLNQVSEIQLDSEIISTRICDIIVPKIQALLGIGQGGPAINATDGTTSKKTFLVHSETSPKTLYDSPSYENFRDFQFQGNAHNTNMNVRSSGNLMELKNIKNVTQYLDLMGLIFKISSMFTNTLAEVIQDVTYYEDMRQEVIT